MTEPNDTLGETIEITPQTFHSYELLQIYIDRARLYGILDRLSKSSNWMCSSISFFIAGMSFFITLVTADFRSIGALDGGIIRIGVIVLTLLCGLAGTLSLVRFVANGSKRNADHIIDTEILQVSSKSIGPLGS